MPERDRARDRARPFAHRVAVVAALDHPLRSGAPGDNADVMAPHHDGADARTAGATANSRPIACKPQIAPRHAEAPAEPPAAPRARLSAPARRCRARATTMPPRRTRHMMRDARLVRRAVDRMVVLAGVGTRFGIGLREGDHAGEHERRSNKFLLHHHSDCSREPQPPTTARADWKATRARR